MNRLKLSKLSKFLKLHLAARLSGWHSETPDSRTCWVDSEVQWEGWQLKDGKEQHQGLGWGGLWDRRDLTVLIIWKSTVKFLCYCSTTMVGRWFFYNCMHWVQHLHHTDRQAFTVLRW